VTLKLGDPWKMKSTGAHAKVIALRLRTILNKTSPHKTMLIKIGKSAVSAKEVKNVRHCPYNDQAGRVYVILFDGTEIVEDFNSELEAETSKKVFIQHVNQALKLGYCDW